ncbi:MAG: hypothetical protein ACRCTA_05710, partial [Bacilli bacterium]
MILLDNNKIGVVKNYVKINTHTDAVFSFTSPIFTLNAFQELSTTLEKCKQFNFLFSEPIFIENIDSNDKVVKEFGIEMNKRANYITEFPLEIHLKNNLNQDQIAIRCHDYIKEKGVVKAVLKSGVISDNIISVSNVNEPNFMIRGGSIGFSMSGLGITTDKKYNFNTVHTDQEMIKGY